MHVRAEEFVTYDIISSGTWIHGISRHELYRPVACKRQGMQYVIIADDVITGGSFIHWKDKRKYVALAASSGLFRILLFRWLGWKVDPDTHQAVINWTREAVQLPRLVGTKDGLVDTNSEEKEAESSRRVQRAEYRSAMGISIYKFSWSTEMLFSTLFSKCLNRSYLCSEFVSQVLHRGTHCAPFVEILSPCPCRSCQQTLLHSVIFRWLHGVSTSINNHWVRIRANHSAKSSK